MVLPGWLSVAWIWWDLDFRQQSHGSPVTEEQANRDSLYDKGTALLLVLSGMQITVQDSFSVTIWWLQLVDI